MAPLLIAGVVAFVLCLILTPLVRDVFLRIGLVDTPDGARKVHPRPVPRAGGISVAISYAAALAAAYWAALQTKAAFDHNLVLVWRLLPAAALVFGTGLLDDLVGLKPWHKLAGIIAAGAVAWSCGVQLVNIAGHLVQPPWGFILTIVWLAGCTNAFNLIDGLDGLATGIGLFATVTTLIVALVHGSTGLALAAAPLVGCLLGFLVYNFNPASIFLGDSGSLLIGFLLGCYGIIWSQKCATLLEISAPLMTLAIPLTDTVLSMTRRFIRLQPIFGADNDHIHHRLLKRAAGNPRNVAILIYMGCGLAAGFSLLESVMASAYSAAVVCVFCVAILAGIHSLGYIEFRVAGRVLLGGQFRRMLRAEVRLRALEESLTDASSADDFWLCIVQGSRVFDFSRVSLAIGGRVYEERFDRAPSENCWSISIPLTSADYIEFAQEFCPCDGALSTALFVDVVRRSCVARLRELHAEAYGRMPSRLEAL
jgi:UDP-GlcNAc:undecaprenyl-phosphate GlcNAc-1-phosphate transferase